jgi:large subunit ribosomal protein L6
MSKVGKASIAVVPGVEIQIDNEKNIRVKGPKGTVVVRPALPAGLSLKLDGATALIECANDEMSALHGLFRSLVQNAVIGVTDGYQIRLALLGVGYKANLQGSKLDLAMGFSHPVKLDIPEGISVTVDKTNTVIVINGIDKQQVGKFAAEVREVRPPEPYKGKGIRYETDKNSTRVTRHETVRRKEGKAAKGKA